MHRGKERQVGLESKERSGEEGFYREARKPGMAKEGFNHRDLEYHVLMLGSGQGCFAGQISAVLWDGGMILLCAI